MTIHPQYVVDENQNRKAVILTLEEWRMVLDELEELDDIRAYDEAVAGDEESVPFEQAVREIDQGQRG